MNIDYKYTYELKAQSLVLEEINNMLGESIERMEKMNYDDVKSCKVNEHEWVEIQKPEGNQSGYHIDKCIRCGKVNTYDTSD